MGGRGREGMGGRGRDDERKWADDESSVEREDGREKRAERWEEGGRR